MADDYRRVSVWVGCFDSPGRRDAYLAERYDDDDAPISAFARDVGVWFYDHDFVESSLREATRELANLLDGQSWAASYLAAADARFVNAYTSQSTR